MKKFMEEIMKGLSHATHEEEMCTTAVQLAQAANVDPNDIRYWGRAEFLQRKSNGQTPYPLSQLPKARLMGVFAKRLHMDADNASRIADQLISRYSGRADSYDVLTSLARVIDTRIEEFVNAIVETGFLKNIEELLTEQAESNNGGPPC